jgi:hypothetical protein
MRKKNIINGYDSISVPVYGTVALGYINLKFIEYNNVMVINQLKNVNYK